MDDPSAAVMLFVKEYREVAASEKTYYREMRGMLRQRKRLRNYKKLRKGNIHIFSQVDTFFVTLIQKPLSVRTSKQLIVLNDFFEILKNIDENLFQKTKCVDAITKNENNPLCKNYLESLLEMEEVIFTEFLQVLSRPDPRNISLLLKHIELQINLGNRLKEKYFLEAGKSVPSETDACFLSLTSLFTKNLWFFKKTTQFLEQSPFSPT